MPINKSDILIIHSSFNLLLKNGITPCNFVDFLFTEIIPNGTIVCPTFPLYRNEPRGLLRLNDSLYSEVFEYNVQRTRSWTGSLGRYVQSIPGSRRSLIPLNTLTAYGSHVDQIFSSESLTPLLTPCGRHSPWYQLFNMDAKILAIGTDLAHSLTMIHVAEDCFEDLWPVKNWYRKRTFNIIDNNQNYFIDLRERHPRWAISYAERSFSRDLFINHVAQNYSTQNLQLYLTQSQPLVKYLLSRRGSYPYYLTALSSL
ncbi:AAC(3) family N-acetyltransferase [bacterium]|nr:AAC(3) family N-acetyltransferase [bacterium]